MFIISTVIGLIMMFAIPVAILHALFPEKIASRIISALSAVFIGIYIYCFFTIIAILFAFLAGVDLRVLESTITEWYANGTFSADMLASTIPHLAKIFLMGYVMFVDALVLATLVTGSMFGTFSIVFALVWLIGLIATWKVIDGLVIFAFHIEKSDPVPPKEEIFLGGNK